MLTLADTSIRLYRRSDERASLRLRNYFIVTTKVGFRLSAYLRDISCKLTLPSKQVIIFDEIAFTEDPICKFDMETMVHDFWAAGIADLKVIRNGLGTLRLDYRISFTGHTSEKAQSLEVVVPLIKRTSSYAL